MDLLDRFSRHALIAAAGQIVFLLIAIGAAFASGLGSKAVFPILFFLVCWAAMVWMTLFRPWDVGWWSFERLNSWTSAREVFAEMPFLIGASIGLLCMHLGHVARAAEKMEKMKPPSWLVIDPFELARQPDPAEVSAWNADTLGWSIVASGDFALPVASSVFLVVLFWVFFAR